MNSLGCAVIITKAADMELQITEWVPSTLPVDATILVVGKRNSGKSVLTRDLMWHMRGRLDLVCGMNPTEAGNGNLQFFTPRAFVFDGFEDEKLRHLLEWQRRCVAHGKARRVGFIMDDCMSEKTAGAGKTRKKVMSSDDVNKVFKVGRHLKLWYLNAMQYIKDAPPDVRGNVDLLFAFNTSSGSEREKLWKEYFSMFSFKDFNKVFEACATGYDCIVLDTRRMATHPKECVMYYRAALHAEPFQVGKRVYADLSSYYYLDRADYDMSPQKVLGPAHAAMSHAVRRHDSESEEVGAAGDNSGMASGNSSAPPAKRARQSAELMVTRKPRADLSTSEWLDAMQGNEVDE